MAMVGNGALKRRLKFIRRNGKGYWRGSAAIAGAGRLQRAKDLLAGFDPREADWYRQIRGDTDGVISNSEREHELHGLNGHYAYVLDNKAVFGESLEMNGLPTPRLFACHYAGHWHWTKGGEAALREHFAGTGRFVIKPTLGSKGRAIQIGRSLDAIAQYRGEDAILTGFVEQAGYAQTIFPGALNTIRFLMLRDEAGEPVAAAAIHRFGTASSAPVDNFSAGGLVAKIDLETGGLSEAITIAPDNRVVRHAVHPDTQSAIAGIMVPHWQGVLDLVLALGRAFPYLAYVGWDIAVTKDGPTVIEGNAHPSLRFFQLYDQLLGDPRLRPILARYISRARPRAG
ncbi:sugar-transfer associated ATP-grasp domain-containing protein [Tabrizicola sp.]|uniref:sugar-transfer associated ATP-grasp domain-containing protein n=1 Tax=Tabrizicola sp. TaxID=2005166 RepID=UPI003F2C18F9